jgi:hypothetical protein
MRMGKITIYMLGAMLALTASCSSNDTQIAENTFIHGHKIYKMIDNELREVGDLNASEIKKFEVSQPKQRDLGTSDLSFVKPGASTSLKALYRGNYLYYSLQINGINELRDNYLPGRLTLEFADEFGFILHAIEIPTSDLVGMVGESGKPESFTYNGKTEMSTEINTAIKKYSVTASIKKM